MYDEGRGEAEGGGTGKERGKSRRGKRGRERVKKEESGRGWRGGTEGGRALCGACLFVSLAVGHFRGSIQRRWHCLCALLLGPRRALAQIPFRGICTLAKRDFLPFLPLICLRA